MERYRLIAETLTCPISPEFQEQVIYHMHELKSYSLIEPFIILAQSQFLFFHEQHMATHSEILVNRLNNEITSGNKAVIEACILGLSTLSGIKY